MESIGFEFNTHDPCAANKIMHGKQLIETIHVVDTKSSNVYQRVNDDFIQFIYWKHGDQEIGEVKSTGGKIHNHLRMMLNYSDKVKFKIDMIDYVKQMINDFPIKLDKNDTETTTTNDTWFKKDNIKILSKERVEIFHTITAKGLF